MSMPIIERPENPINREQSISDLIESVALMETGLSHVINAEGEKIQKVADPDANYPLEDIIAVNNSAEKMINTISKLEMMLQSKLETSKELDTGTEPESDPIGAIIQYNSQVNLNTTAAGLPNGAELIAFETGAASINLLLNGNTEEFENLGAAVFPLPRDGVLTSISAFFDLFSGSTAEAQVVARLYKADPYSSTYHPIEGAIINLTPLIPAGVAQVSVAGSINDLNIPVEANDKIGMLFYCTSTTNITMTGYAGAAINIQ